MKSLGKAAKGLVFVLFAAASILSTIPPLILALVFQRYITSLNIADPVTVQGE